MGDPPSLSPAGAIRRSELRHYLSLGPAGFIQLVKVKAAFHDGRFFGWRILSYRGPGDIRPGDIVTRINGLSIERPEQVMAVWSQLQRIRVLEVSLVREGRLVILSYPVEG